MDKIIFSVDDVRVLKDERNDSQFATLEVDVFASGSNLHNMYVSEETLKSKAFTILNKPFVFDIDKRFDDLSTHTATQVPGGFVPADSPITYKQMPDGRTMMSVIVLIWKRYSGKLMDYLQRDGGRKGVSVEMELFDKKSADRGMTELLDFCYSAITGLGDMIKPAIPDAQAVMQFALHEKQDYEKAYNVEFGIDMTIPENVKFNAKKALELYDQYKIGGTSVGLSINHDLLNCNEIDNDRLNYLTSYFSKQKIQIEESPPSSDYITYLLHGGHDALEWSTQLSKKIVDRKFNFAEVVTMSYKKIGEINPALKGIDPPISLGQANAIAKQADAIGTDGKNGWAIAISNFKKTHKVNKEGHWIKVSENNTEKKEMAMEEEKDKKEEMAIDTPEEEKVETKEQEEKETPEEEKKEKEEGVEKEPQKEKMSLDQYLDTAAMLAMLQEETEDYRVMVDEMAKPDEDKNYALMCGKMFAKMCKMSETNKAYMGELECAKKELEELRKFKKDVEDKQFQFAVDSALSEVSYCVPEVIIGELKDESKNFSIDNIDAWKNLVKARAFEFAVKVDKEQPKEKKYGLPFADTTTKSNSIWTR